jgi:hypothetical protein
MFPRETLSAFDRYLAGHALRFSGIVIGGTALNLLGIVLRWIEEQDLNPDWPAHVRATLADLGRRLGHAL